MMKKIIFGLVGLVLVLVVVSGFWGIGGGEEPELAPFEASVTVQNEAPFVASVTPLGLVNPVGGSAATTEFVFIVEDNNGVVDITGATVQYTSPSGSVVRPSGAPADCVPEAGGGVNQQKFRCTIFMAYYDEPGTWDVEIVASDTVQSATCSPLDSSGCGPVVNHPADLQFYYNELYQLDIKSGCVDPETGCSIDWPSISLSAVDQIADTSLVMINNGNVVLDNMEIAAYDLDGLTVPAESIPSEYFSLSALTGDIFGVGGGPDGTTDECGYDSAEPTAFQVPAEGAAAVPVGSVTQPYGLNIPVGDTGNNEEEGYFCLWESLISLGLSIQTYEAPTLWQMNVIIP